MRLDRQLLPWYCLWGQQFSALNGRHTVCNCVGINLFSIFLKTVTSELVFGGKYQVILLHGTIWKCYKNCTCSVLVLYILFLGSLHVPAVTMIARIQFYFIIFEMSAFHFNEKIKQNWPETDQCKSDLVLTFLFTTLQSNLAKVVNVGLEM